MSGVKKKAKAQRKAHKFYLDKRTMLRIEIIAGIVLFVYLAGSIFFGSHFYIRSRVNGVGASFRTAEGAYEKILSNADKYTITFENEEGEVVNEVSAADLGVDVNYQVDEVQALLDQQTGFNWVGRLLIPAENYTKTGNAYDEAKVKQVASSLDFSHQKSTKESEDAYIKYDGNEFVIVDEIYGDRIDAEGVEEAIIYAVENLQTKINISDGTCYHKPAVKAEDKNINAAKDLLNKYMNVNIHYDLGEGISEEIPKEVKSGFFKWDNDFKVEFDREAIGEYVNSMGDKYNTYGKKKQFVTTEGEEIEVPAGSFGWRIAYDGEIDAIIADFKAGQDVTRDFTYLYRGTSHGEKDYGNSYVEVNLTTQHVYVYKDGAMVLDTSCVSGNISKGHGTHTGVYPIAYKQKDATLRGDNYESHVNYWMPFNMGEGLHDATWRSKFGGTLYKTSGSHGCVNLPLSQAEKIYDIVEAGWPVIVFYTGDTEEENFRLQNPQIDVMNLIADIETVTLESEAKIALARQKYDSLSEEQKPLVTNYEDLVNAELVLQTLKAQAAELAPTEGEVVDGNAIMD
ncbi:L,D-transpeptidase family protein [Pseudobutyrivibrio xylanivorans]|uniref:Putative peptidoglycan binding domain-containing protein n=1 Tax=Pseudobutyrivibrio xylanivorans DSM 14809 TaxID=1123012 RepID=A0A1M6ILU4_PSEXY|nr:L,D-transpeptidase family protein [Pseudobutyrivibrio xylanivorans]SHJ35441.1 Putative peptidoglycan binding domain-containing protein [Pseudobutyrivibrio xylanivorans DSM 14809]